MADGASEDRPASLDAPEHELERPVAANRAEAAPTRRPGAWGVAIVCVVSVLAAISFVAVRARSERDERASAAQGTTPSTSAATSSVVPTISSIAAPPETFVGMPVPDSTPTSAVITPPSTSVPAPTTTATAPLPAVPISPYFKDAEAPSCAVPPPSLLRYRWITVNVELLRAELLLTDAPRLLIAMFPDVPVTFAVDSVSGAAASGFVSAAGRAYRGDEFVGTGTISLSDSAVSVGLTIGDRTFEMAPTEFGPHFVAEFDPSGPMLEGGRPFLPIFNGPCP